MHMAQATFPHGACFFPEASRRSPRPCRLPFSGTRSDLSDAAVPESPQRRPRAAAEPRAGGGRRARDEAGRRGLGALRRELGLRRVLHEVRDVCCSRNLGVCHDGVTCKRRSKCVKITQREKP